MIVALYVQKGGCYFGLPNVDPWSEECDARTYAGPWPVVAHPPCQRWGRYWHGSPRKPHRYQLGDDGGCFAAALAAVRRWGGVLEHPAHTHAWKSFDLMAPRGHGWTVADWSGGWCAHVEQAHYGHMARKATWLYAVGCDLPPLEWRNAPQRLPQVALDRYGYERARRTGVMAYVGGKDKSIIRAATPIPFRDLLISIAESASQPVNRAPSQMAGVVKMR